LNQDADDDKEEQKGIIIRKIRKKKNNNKKKKKQWNHNQPHINSILSTSLATTTPPLTPMLRLTTPTHGNRKNTMKNHRDLSIIWDLVGCSVGCIPN
jgi:hypothetical protein